MFAGSLITASNLMSPWQLGQVRTSTAKVRAKGPPTGGIRRPAALGGARRSPRPARAPCQT